FFRLVQPIFVSIISVVYRFGNDSENLCFAHPNLATLFSQFPYCLSCFLDSLLLRFHRCFAPAFKGPHDRFYFPDFYLASAMNLSAIACALGVVHCFLRFSKYNSSEKGGGKRIVTCFPSFGFLRLMVSSPSSTLLRILT